MPNQITEVSLVPNAFRIEIAEASVRDLVVANNGYCPCAIYKTPDTKCMCKEFREQMEPGLCHCGLYRKVLMES